MHFLLIKADLCFCVKSVLMYGVATYHLLYSVPYPTLYLRHSLTCTIQKTSAMQTAIYFCATVISVKLTAVRHLLALIPVWSTFGNTILKKLNKVSKKPRYQLAVWQCNSRHISAQVWTLCINEMQKHKSSLLLSNIPALFVCMHTYIHCIHTYKIHCMLKIHFYRHINFLKRLGIIFTQH